MSTTRQGLPRRIQTEVRCRRFLEQHLPKVWLEKPILVLFARLWLRSHKDGIGLKHFGSVTHHSTGWVTSSTGLTWRGGGATGANKYEVQKFARAETFVSKSVHRVVSAAQRRSGFWSHRKAVRTCSARGLGLTAGQATMRGQALGAVEGVSIRGVSGYVQSGEAVTPAEVSRIG